MPGTQHHRVVIVGGGTAGVTTAARLRRHVDDIAIVEPSDSHYYQPLWTLVGAGMVDREKTRRPEASVIPKGVTWFKESVGAFEPDANLVHTTQGSTIEYDALVVCPGIQLDWNRLPGVSETLGQRGVSSNYGYDLAPKTWEFVKSTKRGTAVFTMPSGAIKCGGAPQKAAYMACDRWREAGVLDDIDVHLIVPGPRIFGLPAYADALDAVIADYGIHLHVLSELDHIDPDTRRAVFTPTGDGGDAFELEYDMMHVVPPQSAPDWVKASPLATSDPTGYVDIDPATLAHVSFPNVFALGDAGSCPNGKTGAAVRKQAPVVVDNLVAHLDRRPLEAAYHGYSSCPLVTSSNRMLLAEFDYSGEHTPSIPFIDLTKPRYDMWLLKRYGLPFLYWHLMLKGRA